MKIFWYFGWVMGVTAAGPYMIGKIFYAIIREVVGGGIGRSRMAAGKIEAINKEVSQGSEGPKKGTIEAAIRVNTKWLETQLRILKRGIDLELSSFTEFEKEYRKAGESDGPRKRHNFDYPRIPPSNGNERPV